LIVALLRRFSIINGFNEGIWNRFREKKSGNTFFLPFWVQKCVFGDPGHETDPKNRISVKQNTKTGHKLTRKPGFLGFKTNMSGSTIPTRLRFSTTIQSATTKNRFRRLSGTARGCEIVNSDDPTSWIASLSTMHLRLLLPYHPYHE